MSFRLKTILGIAAIEIVLLAILVVSGLHYLKTSNETELLRSGNVTARLFSTMIADAVVATDLATLDSLVTLTLRNDGLDYVRVRNIDGKVIAQGGAETALRANFKPDASIEDTLNDQRLDLSSAISVAGQKFGSVEIGLSTVRLETTFVEALKWMLSIAATEILLVAIFGLILGTLLTRQLARLRTGAKRVAAGEFGYQLDVKGKDELADTSTSFNSMSNALAKFARDVEEARRQAEARRDYAETVLQDALNSMPQGMVIVNDTDKVEFANTAFIRRYPGIDKIVEDQPNFVDLSTFTLSSIEVPSSIPADSTVEKRVERRLERLHAPQEYDHWESKHQNGQVLLNTQSQMRSGGVVIVENDITELTEANEKNRRLELELLQNEKMKSLGTLAGGTAHEFNNLLVPMISLTEMVMEDMDEESEERQDLERVIEAGLRAQGLIKQILSFSRAEKPEDIMDSETVETIDLGTVTLDALKLVQATTPSSVSLTHDINDGSFPVALPHGQLHQIVMNMVGNATHAIDGKIGTIHLSIRSEPIDPATAANHPGVSATNHACLKISDSGSGMDDETKNRIFEPFFTTKEVGQGTGMGLSVIHGIVSKANGFIAVDSVPGQGTDFEIYLPLTDESEVAEDLPLRAVNE